MTGGLTLAGTPERWEWLQANYRIFQSIGIDDCELLTPEEARRCRSCRPTGSSVRCGPTERAIDTTGTVQAYATAAKNVARNTTKPPRWKNLTKQPMAGGCDNKGTITCEHVVNAAGLWAKQVGRMAGELPVSPLKHHYLSLTRSLKLPPLILKCQ